MAARCFTIGDIKASPISAAGSVLHRDMATPCRKTRLTKALVLMAVFLFPALSIVLSAASNSAGSISAIGRAPIALVRCEKPARFLDGGFSLSVANELHLNEILGHGLETVASTKLGCNFFLLSFLKRILPAPNGTSRLIPQIACLSQTDLGPRAERYLKNQSFPPLGRTSRYRPFSSVFR
jgi:hypothetical protein